MQVATRPRATRRRLLKDRNGCIVCRRRKVKCDGRENGCLNCERLNFKCSLSSPLHPTSYNGADEDVIPRRRVRQACEPCRMNKLRCSGALPQCERCKSKGLECMYRYTPTHQSGATQSPVEPENLGAPCETQVTLNGPSETSQTPPTESSYTRHIRGLDVSKLVIQQHIDAFFQFVYVVGPFNYIHRGSFLRTWHNGKMAKSLICAVFGVASRFMQLGSLNQDTDGVISPSNLMSQVEHEVLCDIRQSTIPKLQILLLLLYDRTMSGDLSAVWHLAVLASRNAYGLQLNHPIDIIPFTNQECRRRLMWCTYIMDKFSTGTIYPALCSRETMHIQLPCDSRSFDLEFECKNPSLEEFSQSLDPYLHSSTLGSTSYLIRVLDLRDQIKGFIDLEKKRYSTIKHTSWENNMTYTRLQEQLAIFCNGLPPDMQDSERATYIRANTPESDAYIMVQGWLRASWCELLREAVSLHESSISKFAETCARQLMQQAIRLSQFMKAMVDVQSPSRKFFVTDWSIAPCMMEMTKALLHCAEQPSISHSRDSITLALALNFEILDPLAEISQFVASWRDEIIYIISRSAFAEVVQHRVPKSAERSLVPENVLAEARRFENARFPRHAAFRKRAQVATGANHPPRSELYGTESLGLSIDTTFNPSDNWGIDAGVHSAMSFIPNEIPSLDMDCFYAEGVEGLPWDLSLCPVNV